MYEIRIQKREKLAIEKTAYKMEEYADAVAFARGYAQALIDVGNKYIVHVYKANKRYYTVR